MDDLEQQVEAALGERHDTVSLESASWEQLLTELERRYNAVVLIVINPLVGDQSELIYGYRGGYYQSIGMVERFRQLINNPPESTDDDD